MTAGLGSRIHAYDSADRIVGYWLCVKAPDPDDGDPHGKWEWRDA